MEAEALSFRLIACRELMEKHPESVRIREQVEVIEASYPDKPGTMVAFCKSIIETTCKTILKERGVTVDPQIKFTELAAQTRGVLGLEKPKPGGEDEKIRKNVGLITGGVGQIVEGLGNLRSSDAGFGHGAEAYAPMLDIEFTELLVRSADAVVGLFFKTHLKSMGADPLETIRYGDHPDFDDTIDGNFGPFEVLETPIVASEALFKTDMNAYRSALVEYISERDSNRLKIIQLLRAKL
ncbi:abortive infection family protein [Rhizobium leguminosarum]|uniref:abortive infection family protein n=1 Tax=Rhizobium leguminosarum TaxID=384 RepID=UPI003F9EB554